MLGGRGSRSGRAGEETQPQPHPLGRNPWSSPLKAGESGPNPALSISGLACLAAQRRERLARRTQWGGPPGASICRGAHSQGRGPTSPVSCSKPLSEPRLPPPPLAQWGQALGRALQGHRHSFPAELIRGG